MLVKYKAGRYAGEIRDLRSDIALEMLRLGRVDKAFPEESVSAPARAQSPAPVPARKAKKAAR